MLRNLRKVRLAPFSRFSSEECGVGGEIYGPDHYALQESLYKIIDAEINPYVEEWERAGAYPAHEVMTPFLRGSGLLYKI